MKRLIKRNVLLLALVIFGSTQFAQGYVLNYIQEADNPNVGYSCDNTLELDFWNDGIGQSATADFQYRIVVFGINSGDQFQVIVDWGDGSSTPYFGTYVNSGTPLFSPGTVQHSYAPGGTGNYPITITVINPNDNTTISNAAYTNYVYSNNCPTYIYNSVDVDCNNDGVVDSSLYSGVDMIITDSSGATYPFTTDFAQNVIPNLQDGNYTLTVDPAWLAANNYDLMVITPINFSVQSGNSSQITFYAILNCSGTQPILDGCVYGQVFCDLNNNGIFDNNETGVYNAPVSVTYNNQTILVYTDPNGLYSVSATNGNQSVATISVDPNWLGQNGYQYVSNSITDTLLECQTPGPTFANFPLNCDSAQVSTECLYGWVFCDENGNGSLDSGEVVLPNAPIEISGGAPNTITIYSDSNGVISYSAPAYFGFTAILTVPNWWLTQNGYTMTNNVFTVQLDCNNPQPAYIAVNCSPTYCSDLWTAVTPWIGYYQNQTNYIRLKWGNYGPNATTGYTVSLTFPSSVTPILSTITNPNYVVTGNTITWTFGPGASYIYESDIIGFTVPSGYPSGTSHSYTSVITALGSTTDCNNLNNDGSVCMILGNSYDPNDKSVSHPPIIDPSVQDELTYVLRFQNTGTAPAQDVYIIDTLSANLDWSTLKVISTSHNMQLVDLGNGVMKFNFPGIWLPDSTANEPESHGDVVFSIKENAGNGIGSMIENTGYIYFDWNPAIITNTTVNTNNVLSLDETVNEIGISPNPFTGTVKVVSAKKIDEISVLDITGKVIFETAVNDFNTQLELQQLTQGIYFVNVTAGTEVTTSRIVKQ